MITILNSSVLTNYGEYSYTPLTINEAAAILKQEDFVSAIGHEETVKLFSVLTGITIPFNRIEYRQQPGERAIVFKIRRRLELGEHIEAKDVLPGDYECGILVRKN